MSKRARPSIARQEFEASYSELMDSSPHVVLRKFMIRHDQLIEQVTADSFQEQACVKGCAYCCHFKVVADAVEIFSIVEYVRSNLDSQQINQIMQAAKRNVEETKHLNHEEQSTINQKCPLLVDESCVVYPVRSIKCRNFHATDNSSCRASYENPKDLTILNQSIEELYIAATGSSDGFMAALHTCGYDDRIYDLNGAFIEAFEDADCRRRYDAGKRAFKTVKYDND